MPAKSNGDIWNKVITLVSGCEFPTNNKVLNETFTVFQYYSELESGRHESLLNWSQEYVKKVGISSCLKELVMILEKIGAHDYAAIEKEYGEEIWRMFIALENNVIEEEQFYTIIEKVDNQYNKLNGKLGELLEKYFVEVYPELDVE